MDIAMIHCGGAPHPAHKGFGEAVNADFLSLSKISDKYNRDGSSIPEEIFSGALLSSYDVYIAEGTRALYGAITNQIVSQSTLIYLAGDQAIYKLVDSNYEVDSPINKIISSHGIEILKKLFNEYIDGIIAMSEFSADYTRWVLPDKPLKIVHPYIQPDLFAALETCSPKLYQNVAVTVGAYDKYKGQEMLVNAWQKVRSAHPDAELLLVGSGYPSRFNSIPGVQTLGYVEDLPETFNNASLYVQSSRVDNFPVGVLEAMRAGLPAAVTNTTGSKSAVAKVSTDLIMDPEVNDISNRVNNYFLQDISKKQEWSVSARNLGSQFDSETQKNKFHTTFHELISQL